MPDLKHLPAFDFESKEFLEQNCTKIFGNMAYLRLHGRNADSWYASTSNEKNDKNGSARYEYFYSDEELFSSKELDEDELSDEELLGSDELDDSSQPGRE